MQSRAEAPAAQSRSRWRTATVGIGVTLLVCAVAYVLMTFRWAELAAVLARTDALIFLGGGSATILAYWLLRTARWALLLGAVHESVSFKELYLSTALSLGLAIVTPLQSGEASKVEWLKRRGKLDRTTGYGAFAMERLLDLAVACAFALVSLGGLASTALFPWLIAGLVVGLACLIGIVRIARFNRTLASFISSFRLLAADTPLLLKALALTIAAWLVVALGWRICLASLSIAVGAADAVSLVGLITIANILSFVPGAWGISEIGIAEFLRLTGHEPLAAQAGAIIIRGYGILALALAVLHLALAVLTPRRAARGQR